MPCQQPFYSQPCPALAIFLYSLPLKIVRAAKPTARNKRNGDWDAEAWAALAGRLSSREGKGVLWVDWPLVMLPLGNMVVDRRQRPFRDRNLRYEFGRFPARITPFSRSRFTPDMARTSRGGRENRYKRLPRDLHLIGHPRLSMKEVLPVLAPASCPKLITDALLRHGTRR